MLFIIILLTLTQRFFFFISLVICFLFETFRDNINFCMEILFLYQISSYRIMSKEVYSTIIKKNNIVFK